MRIIVVAHGDNWSIILFMPVSVGCGLKQPDDYVAGQYK
jgi:hypothetical protein